VFADIRSAHLHCSLVERRLFGQLPTEELVSTATRTPPSQVVAGERGTSSTERGSSPGTLLGPEGSSDRFFWASTPSNYLVTGATAALDLVSEDLVVCPPVI
jgi:hypothetical protein